jgi:L-ascorbate metabolism protein UlaG (beta-lactamase superfamily)
MKHTTFTWLGQAGLFFEIGGLTVMVDPYLSDSCATVACHRHMPIDERFLSMTPDVLLLTHNHLDHTDPETLSHILRENTAVTVLCPRSSWQHVRTYPGSHNPVQVSPGVVWTQGEVTFTAVGAAHSDPDAVGFLMHDGERTYYITGDTLYAPSLLSGFPPIDTVFLPINGRGNNMNAADAAKLATQIGARRACPIHWGMLDTLTSEIFRYDEVLLPQLYVPITL